MLNCSISFSTIFPIERKKCQNKVVLLQCYAAGINTNKDFRDILFLSIRLDIKHRECVLLQVRKCSYVFRYEILFFVAQCFALRSPIFGQLFCEIDDQFRNVRGGENFTDVVNPLWVVFVA